MEKVRVIVTLEFNDSVFDLYVTPWVSVINSQQKFVSFSRYFLPPRLFYIRDSLLWHAATVSPFTYFIYLCYRLVHVDCMVYLLRRHGFIRSSLEYPLRKFTE